MQALKKRRSPGAERAVTRALERKAKANALAAAPVEKPATFAPLGLQWADFHPIRSTEWVDVTVPDEDFKTHARQASIVDEPSEGRIRGSAANDRAALRQQLLNAEEYGPTVMLSLMVETGPISAKTIVVEGRLSAIRAMFPDQTTLKAWRDAGALEMSAPNLDYQFWATLKDAAERVRYLSAAGGAVRRVSLDEAPRVVQMEYTSRSLGGRLKIATDEILEERRRAAEEALKKERKEKARQALDNFDIRAELAGVAYQGRAQLGQ